MTAYFARTYQNGNATLSTYAVPFPYINENDVTVSVDGVLVTVWVWLTTSEIQGTFAAGTANVLIQRQTQRSSNLAIIQAGTILPSDINLDNLQLLYLYQEALDVTTFMSDQQIPGLLATAEQALAVAQQASAAVVGGAYLWGRPCASTLTAPPGSPNIGDRYLVGIGGTGAWFGADNQVAEWSGTVWLFSGVPLQNQPLEIGNTTYRYSQEAHDGSIAWRPIYIAAGGTRGVGDPVDEPCGLNNIAVDGRVTTLGTTAFGAAAGAVLHFQRARGTQLAPTMPLNGDSCGSVGYRAFDTTPELFFRSSAALTCNLTEDARAGDTTGIMWQVELTRDGGAQPRRPTIKFNSDGSTIMYGTAGYISNSFAPATGSIAWWNGDGGGGPSAFNVQTSASIGIAVNRNGSDGSAINLQRETITVGNISVSSSATTYNTTSDERLKDFGVPQRSHDDIVDQIVVADAAFHTDLSKSPVLSISAQQVHALGYVEAIKPPSADMVPDTHPTTGEALLHDPEPRLDANGNQVYETEGSRKFPAMWRRPKMRLETPEEVAKKHWQADYGRLGILALKGVQNDRKRISALEAQVAELLSRGK